MRTSIWFYFNFKQLFLLLFIFSPAIRPLQGQINLTLNQCLDLALKQSYLVQAAGVAIEIAETKYAASASQQWPNLSLNGAYTRIGKVTSFSIPMGPGGSLKTFQFGTPNRMNADLKFQVPLFTWGRIQATLGLARTATTLATLQRQQEKIRTVDQVLRAYFAVLLNQEIIHLNTVNVQRADTLWQISGQRYAAGMIPQLEVLRAEVQLKNAQSTLAEVRENLAKSKLFLAKMIGLNAEKFTLAARLENHPVAVDPDSVMPRALRIRSDRRALQIQQELAVEKINLARSGNKPNFFAFSGYNVTNGFDPMAPDRFIDNWNLGVQVTVPLFDGFNTRYQVQEAQLQLKTLALQDAEIQELICLQIRQAFISLRQAENKIKMQIENIALAQATLQLAEKQFQDGVVSSLDVLTAQQTLAQNELLHVQAIFNQLMAQLELAKIIEDYTWFGNSLAPF
ncbi:TolC family protein [candidate division KSB1 bacterium]|nr:TolC family protein [candidate division KSB1 bacterium]